MLGCYDRMMCYTSQYKSTHGVTWNRIPISICEITMGEYLQEKSLDLVLAGKTHVLPDSEGLKRLQIDGGSELGHLLTRGDSKKLIDMMGIMNPVKKVAIRPIYVLMVISQMTLGLTLLSQQ